jgi:carbon storage regulator
MTITSERDFMLVLSRKKNENIVIGEDMRVFIVDIRGDTVRLGVSAPDNVPIHRSEVFEAIKQNGIYDQTPRRKR